MSQDNKSKKSGKSGKMSSDTKQNKSNLSDSDQDSLKNNFSILEMIVMRSFIYG